MTRVLVVEDSPDIARLVQRSLLLEGSRSMWPAMDAAPSRGSRHPPDLIVLDLMLPDIDGMEICRRVRAMEARMGSPGAGSDADRTRCRTRPGQRDLDAGSRRLCAETVRDHGADGACALVAAPLASARKCRPKQRESSRLKTSLSIRAPAPCIAGDREIVLTAKQFDLLAALMENPNQVM
jgi:two-component system response regulator MprA